jgi:hypothetical protein
VVVRCNARNAFARLNTGMMGSNSTRGMRIFVVSVLFYVGNGLAMDLSRVQGVLPTVCKIIISELILDGNRPESPICQGRIRIRMLHDISLHYFPFLLDESMNPLVYYFQLIIEMTRYSLRRERTNARMCGLPVNVDSYSSG